MVGSPVDGSDLLIVPGYFFAESTAHALKGSALGLVAQTVGVRDRASVDGHPHALHCDLAGVLIDVDIDDDSGVAVIAFVSYTGDSASGSDTGSVARRFGRWASLPLGGFRRAGQNANDSLIAQMAQAELHRIGFGASGQFIHEAFMRKSVLEARGRTQRTGPEGRDDVVHQRFFALNGSGATADSQCGSADVAGNVGRNPVAVVVIGSGRLGRAGRERRGRESQKHSGDHVAGSRGAGTVPETRRPGFVFPCDDVALGVQSGAFLNAPGIAVILPGHLVFARKLYPHGFADGLRENHGVVADGVGAVQSVAARASAENHVYVFRFQPEDHRAGGFLIPDALGWRIERGPVALDVGDGAGGAHRSMHLVGM